MSWKDMGGLPPFVRRFFRAFGLSRSLALFALALLCLLRISDPFLVEAIRMRVFDLMQVMAPRMQDEFPVVIVDIDEKSLAEIGQWPWPRALLADITAEVIAQRALVLAYDVVFAEPDRTSPAYLADTLPRIDAATRRFLREIPTNDRIIADAFARTRVVLGQTAHPQKLRDIDQGEVRSVSIAMAGRDAKPFLIQYDGLITNIMELDESASGRGLITIRPESDGIIRRAPTLMVAQGHILPSFAAEIIRVGTGASGYLIRADNAGILNVAIGRNPISTDRNGQIWVHFNKHDRRRYVSAVDVLQRRLPDNLLTGKIVLVGTSAVGLYDLKSTPLDPAMPGVEVHAQVLESVLQQATLTRPHYAIAAELVTAVIISLAIIVFVPILGPVGVFLIGLVSAAVTLASAVHAFLTRGVLFDVTFPLIASFIVFAILVFLNYVREETQRRQIRNAFGQYLSPDLVEQLAENPSQLELGGDVREMTVLFCDVRGFTAIAEAHKGDPRGLTQLINDLLTPLSNVVLANRGTIDKYMGDNIMAFWNAPLPTANHSALACASAVEMLDALAEFNRVRREAASSSPTAYYSGDIRIGIGINTGECLVGNMGSKVRFDYTVLGDAVNLASRLEGLSAQYGLPVIVGQKTATDLGDRFAFLRIDLVRVKGKHEAEPVYALLGDADLQAAPQFQVFRETFGQALQAYMAGNWDRADELAQSCCQSVEGVEVGQLIGQLRKRVAHYRMRPPRDNWDGVYDATSKDVGY